LQKKIYMPVINLKSQMLNKRKIFIVTERRADFSRFKPILELIKKNKKLDYHLVVTGTHLVKKHGYTLNEIIESKFKIFAKFSMFNKKYEIKDSGSGMAKALGRAIINLSLILEKSKPDLILSGFDIAANFAATIVGAHMNIPVAHIQGGEVSGNIDESLRHAMSKFSHYHLTANSDSKNRLIKLGEIKKNIFIVGCPSLDALFSEKLISRHEIIKKFNIDISKPYLLIIQHPVTTESEDSKKQIEQILMSLKNINIQKLFILPNNDSGAANIIKIIKKNNVNHATTLKLREYKTLLVNCKILIGNSSSGIHEAASFGIPVINIGNRQKGRLKPKNVIDVKCNSKSILKKINFILKNKKFKNSLRNLKNPYGDGKSAVKIIQILKKINLDKKIIQKQNTY
jgi:GDP/UDP-N,N'-diacetylbacillosamine 2-epimerase (hydrolysing)